MHQPTIEPAEDLVNTDAATTPAAPLEPAPEPAKPRHFGRLVLIGCAIAIIAFAGGIGGVLATNTWLDDEPAPAPTASADPPQPSNASASTSDGALTPREIYQQAAPAVVHINARVTQTDTSFFGIPQEREATGTGSGFVIDRDGYIVTNAHVVEGAEELQVVFGTDATVPAKLVGLDRSTDIAVIKVDPDSKELAGELRTVEFGDSKSIQVGDPVIAIGNPFSLDRTLTTGVVSALQRDIPALNDFQISDVIQTDAAVNPGNSGGPLLDDHGTVIGVNSQIKSKSGGFDGIAFAVPSSTAKRVADELIKNGSVQHAWLGVSGQDLTPSIAEALDLSVTEGVIVGAVTDGSPADKAGITGGSTDIVIEGTGLRPGGDVLLSFDGESLISMRQLAALVDAKSPGDNAKIEFLRNGDRETATVTFAPRPDNPRAQQ